MRTSDVERIVHACDLTLQALRGDGTHAVPVSIVIKELRFQARRMAQDTRVRVEQEREYLDRLMAGYNRAANTLEDINLPTVEAVQSAMNYVGLLRNYQAGRLAREHTTGEAHVRD